MSTDGLESLTSAALLGTARTEPDFAALHTHATAGAIDGTAEHRLLGAAALERAFVAAGSAPATCALPEPAADDDRPLLPPAAAERLRALLTVRSDLIGEWLDAAQGFRAPHGIVVDLLERASALDEDQRDKLVVLLGPRGRWLARQNPRWSDLVAPDTGDPSVWQHGSAATRRRWFRALRAQDPAAATELLTASWKTEAASGRQTLLGELATGSGVYDEELLETALGDRSRKVREVALDLSRRLPDSSFGRRMTRRVQDWTRVQDGALEFTIPDVLDADAVRDGLDDPLPRAVEPARADRTYTDEEIRDRARVWALATSAPLSAWLTPGTPIGDALDLEVSEHLRDVLRHARATAVDHQRDSAWASELLQRDDRTGSRVAGHAPRDVLVEHLRRMSARQPLLVDHFAALPAPWPADIAQKALTVLYTAAAPNSHSFRALTDLLARRAPFELVDLFDDAATRTDDLVRLNRFATAADILKLRRTLHEELS